MTRRTTPEFDKLIDQLENVLPALQGNPQELLDALLVLYGEQYTPNQIKQFVRRFEELDLGELLEGKPGAEGRRGGLFLDFFFKQASLIAQKEQRDRQTLIHVFLKRKS